MDSRTLTRGVHSRHTQGQRVGVQVERQGRTVAYGIFRYHFIQSRPVQVEDVQDNGNAVNVLDGEEADAEEGGACADDGQRFTFGDDGSINTWGEDPPARFEGEGVKAVAQDTRFHAAVRPMAEEIMNDDERAGGCI